MKPALPRCAGPRLYCDLALSPGAEVTLPEAAAHHAVSVLRLQAGDALSLFNGEGGEYRAALVAVNKRESRARLLEFDAAERESRLAVLTLAARHFARGERMDLHSCRRPPSSASPHILRVCQ